MIDASDLQRIDVTTSASTMVSGARRSTLPSRPESQRPHATMAAEIIQVAVMSPWARNTTGRQPPNRPVWANECWKNPYTDGVQLRAHLDLVPAQRHVDESADQDRPREGPNVLDSPNVQAADEVGDAPRQERAQRRGESVVDAQVIGDRTRERDEATDHDREVLPAKPKAGEPRRVEQERSRGTGPPRPTCTS